MTRDETGSEPSVPADSQRDDVAELVALAAAASMSPKRRAAFVTSLLAGGETGGITAPVPKFVIDLGRDHVLRRLSPLDPRSIDVRNSMMAAIVESLKQLDVWIEASAATASSQPASLPWPMVPALKSSRSTAGPTLDDMAEVLTAGFHAAVEAAVEAAHADGHAVSGIEDDVAVEYLPDGTKRAIDQTTDWSPTGWRHR